jgi:hypothetical protein
VNATSCARGASNAVLQSSTVTRSPSASRLNGCRSPWQITSGAGAGGCSVSQRAAPTRSGRPKSAANCASIEIRPGTDTGTPRTCPSSPRTNSGSSACSRAIDPASCSGTWRSRRRRTAGVGTPSSPDSADPPTARSMTMNATPRPQSGPPDARTNGVGKPAAATAVCTIVSLRAVPGSGIRRATSSAGQPPGGCVSEKEKSSAQKPPRMGSGRCSYSRPGASAALRSTPISRPAKSVSTVTVFTVTVLYAIV